MAHLLYITANPKQEDQSFGLAVGRAFLDEYKKQNPNDLITELDLYSMEIPLIDKDVLSGWDQLRKGLSVSELSKIEAEKISAISRLTDQFIQADRYVFVSPMWNLGIPPMLKAYIDTFFIAGKSFKYTANGPVGLLHDKKAIHIQARGGMYSEGPAKEMEFGDRYLQTVMRFLGVESYKSVIVEGMAFMPSEADTIKTAAEKRARELAKCFSVQSITQQADLKIAQ